MRVKCLWVGKALSPLERMSILSWMKVGYAVELFTYGNVANVPDGVFIRSASDILPESSIFEYNGFPHALLPFGGIGSISHWSDAFAYKCLAEEGGIWTQLDVTVLKRFTLNHAGWVWPLGLTAVVPVLACFEKGDFRPYKAFQAIIGCRDRDEWHWAIREASRAVLGPSGLPRLDPSVCYDFGGQAVFDPMKNDFRFMDETIFVHWSNATVGELKRRPRPGSLYHRMCSEFGAIDK